MPLNLVLYTAISVTAKINIIWRFILLVRILPTLCPQCHFSEAVALTSCKPRYLTLSLFKLSTTFQEFIYVGITAYYIICSQVLINVLIYMKVSESHLYHIWNNISREIHAYGEWSKKTWFCMCFSITL